MLIINPVSVNKNLMWTDTGSFIKIKRIENRLNRSGGA